MNFVTSFFKRAVTKKNRQIRILQFLFLAVSIYGLWSAPATWILVGLGTYAFLETLGGNIALHRYFGHKSFKTSRAIHQILAFLGTYLGVGSVISWVGQHRYHHLHSDTDRDLHCPRHRGVFHIFFGIWKVRIEPSMIRDVLKDPTLVFLHRNYWNLHGILILTYSVIDQIFGTWTLFALYALPNIMCLLSGYMLAIVPHLRGYANHETGDRSLNCWITNLYTLGEGWHNNHHAFPQRLRQGEKWWEWDLPAFVVEHFLESKQPRTHETLVRKDNETIEPPGVWPISAK